MSIVQRLFWAHMLAAVAALAVGYAMAGSIFAALIFVFLGAAWFTAQQRGNAETWGRGDTGMRRRGDAGTRRRGEDGKPSTERSSAAAGRGGDSRLSTERGSAGAAEPVGAGMEGLLLFIFVAAAAVGMWLGVPGWLLLIAVVATLGAWDLDHFLQRLSGVERVEFNTGLGREHLRRLGLVEGVGLAAGLFALSTRMKISFWWEALLIVLAVIGIRVVIWFVRKQMER